MKLQLETAARNQYLIRAHGPGRVVINETAYHASLIVTPERLIEHWPPSCFDELKRDHIDVLARLAPEVVLIGTGATLRFPAAELLQPLLGPQIGYEIMDTAAACRTYNILMSEGRKVAAALIIDDEI